MMEKVRKYSGEIDMTWKKVIIFAVITAVYTATVNLIPIFEDTSFRDIAVYPDCWILFAMFIIMNCRKWHEAALKCFVFFLISQPLIYLIEVPFSSLHFGIFQYYRRWFIITLLTLPGAAIAFFVKKKNMLSALILSVATGYLMAAGIRYCRMAADRFPYHILSMVFCFLLALFLIFVLLSGKKERITALLISVAAAAVFGVLTKPVKFAELFVDGSGIEVTVEDASVVEVTEKGEGHYVLKALDSGTTALTFTDDRGVEHIYYVTVSGGSIIVSEFTSN